MLLLSPFRYFAHYSFNVSSPVNLSFLFIFLPLLCMACSSISFNILSFFFITFSFFASLFLSLSSFPSPFWYFLYLPSLSFPFLFFPLFFPHLSFFLFYNIIFLHSSFPFSLPCSLFYLMIPCGPHSPHTSVCNLSSPSLSLFFSLLFLICFSSYSLISSTFSVTFNLSSPLLSFPFIFPSFIILDILFRIHSPPFTSC